MAVASAQGFVGGTNASPTVALHPQGLTDRGGGCPSLATAHTLTADSAECLKISSPGSAINQDLPTTGVKAGKRFCLIVTGATETNYVALRSSGGNEIDRIGGDGVIEAVALQDAPTSAAHWRVVGIWEQTLQITGTANGANDGAITATFRRVQRNVVATVYQAAGTSQAGAQIVTSAVIPVRFRPAVAKRTATPAVSSNNVIMASVTVAVAGTLTLDRENSVNFGATVNAFGVLAAQSEFSYSTT